jgi:hypothetical protein
MNLHFNYAKIIIISKSHLLTPSESILPYLNMNKINLNHL